MEKCVSAVTGLEAEQVSFIMRNLRSVHRSERDDITEEEYQAFLQGTSERLSRQRLRHGNRRRVLRALESARDANPTLTRGNLTALQETMFNAVNLKNQIDSAVRSYARRNNVSVSEAREKFKETYEGVVAPRTQGAQGWVDYRSQMAVSILKGQTPELEREETPRVNVQPVDSLFVSGVGYDPADGRLEIHMVQGEPNLFHSVSPEDAERAMREPTRVLSDLMLSDRNKYSSYSEAVADGFRVKCPSCGQFQPASGHDCPALNRRVSDLETPPPSAPSLQNLIDRSLGLDNAVSEEDLVRLEEVRQAVRETLNNNPVFEGDYERLEATELGDYHYSSERSHAGRSAHAQYITIDSNLVGELLSEETPSRRIWLGRRIAVAGSNGTRFNEATIPYRLSLSGGDRAYEILEERGVAPRCTCDEYQQNGNGRCPHLYPTSEDRINNYVVRDADSGVSALREALGVEGFHDAGDLARSGDWLRAVNEDSSEEALRYALAELANNELFSSSPRGRLANLPEGSRLAELAEETGVLEGARIHIQRLAELSRQEVSGWEIEESSRDQIVSEIRGSRTGEPVYGENLDSFLEDLNSIPDEPGRLSGSVTGGFLSSVDGEGRGFGFELEIENASRGAIVEAMRQAGFDVRASGYYGDNYDVWQVKTDGSLDDDGYEVVSPVLYDNEETWAKVDKLCEILQSQGVTVGPNTGAHVHIGAGGFNSRNRGAVHAAYAAHQDVFYRLSTSDERSTHRSNGYSVPFRGGEVSEIYEARDYGDNVDGNRYRPVNNLRRSTIEFREFDGTINSAHIQANVMMASAVMRAGIEGSLSGRMTGNESNSARVQAVGHGRRNADRLASIYSTDSDEYKILSNLPVMTALDSLFDTREQRKHMLGHILRAPWQG